MATGKLHEDTNTLGVQEEGKQGLQQQQKAA